jgi:hypothetical protein
VNENEEKTCRIVTYLFIFHNGSDAVEKYFHLVRKHPNFLLGQKYSTKIIF